MKVLERVGELEQRQVLLTGWTAYDEVPVKVKRVLGLRVTRLQKTQVNQNP